MYVCMCMYACACVCDTHTHTHTHTNTGWDGVYTGGDGGADAWRFSIPCSPCLGPAARAWLALRGRKGGREREREREREVYWRSNRWLKVGKYNASCGWHRPWALEKFYWQPRSDSRSVSTTPCRVTPPLGARAQHVTASTIPPLSVWPFTNNCKVTKTHTPIACRVPNLFHDPCTAIEVARATSAKLRLEPWRAANSPRRASNSPSDLGDFVCFQCVTQESITRDWMMFGWGAVLPPSDYIENETAFYDETKRHKTMSA